jgi:hypothetical protein
MQKALPDNFFKGGLFVWNEIQFAAQDQLLEHLFSSPECSTKPERKRLFQAKHAKVVANNP